MKTTVMIDVEGLATRLAGLARICPGLRPTGGFRSALAQDDPRNAAILDWLHGAGYRCWERKGDMDLSREYRLACIREYEPCDFAQVEYLEFWPDPVNGIGDCERDEQGHLRLERPTLKKARRTGWDFASATIGQILVLQRVRDLLLEGNFRHLLFRPTVLVTGRGLHPQRCTPIPWEQFKLTQPWWELSSDTVLPPLSPAVDLRDWNSGGPIRPTDRLIRCHAKDGFYNNAELHYRRSDLAKLDPFDVALTFENFGPSHFPMHQTIVSKRFYDYCQGKGLKGRWAPVRIDER